MLPRPVSIFDSSFPTSSIGAPPPMGKGSGQVYLVTTSMKVGSKNVGPALLLVKETNHNDSWGPPGGQTDRTDHSVMFAALREFNEEVGADWTMLANSIGKMTLLRLKNQPSKNEGWVILVETDAQTAENALFGQDRSKWKLSTRMKTKLSQETGGYAFVALSEIVNADPNSGAFKIGPNAVKLRYPEFTLKAAQFLQGLF